MVLISVAVRAVAAELEPIDEVVGTRAVATFFRLDIELVGRLIDGEVTRYEISGLATPTIVTLVALVAPVAVSEITQILLSAGSLPKGWE